MVLVFYALVGEISGPGRTRSLPKGCCVLCARKDGRIQVTHSA